jgi:plastocyanin
MSPSRTFVAVTLLFGARAALADTLTGSIDDPAIRRKADLIYIEQTDAKAPAATAPLVMSQKGNTYLPHVMAVVQGTTITFKSEDPELHNVFARAKRVLFNEAVLPHNQFQKKFGEQGVVHMTCNIHKEMSAYIVVLQNGFFATPDRKTGKFAIEGLPPGSYTVRIWGEQLADEVNAKKWPVTVGQPAKIASR